MPVFFPAMRPLSGMPWTRAFRQLLTLRTDDPSCAEIAALLHHGFFADREMLTEFDRLQEELVAQDWNTLNRGAASAGSRSPSPAPRSLQMIFQDAVGSLNPRMTVRQTLDEVLSTAARGGGSGGAPWATDAAGLLSLVGLSKAVLDQYPRELSGGQCQRVSVARALACRPKVLVADEPVSALDVSVQARVLNLLRDLRRDLGLSIVLIAHDLAVVKNVCDFVCVMEKGLFVDVGETESVFANPKSDYTRRLLSVVPRIPSF